MGASASRRFGKMADQEDSHILMVGLDGVGKTTMLHKMKQGDVVVTAPTIGFNVETIEYRNMNFTVWDIGSQNQKIRPLWRRYFERTRGLIFVVDSSDHTNIDFAQVELAEMLNDKHLQNTSVLVLANKQDLPNAMSSEEVACRLGLHKLQGHRWTVKPTSAMDGTGLPDAMDWLSLEMEPDTPASKRGACSRCRSRQKTMSCE